jgi:hypothetical protein
MVSVLRLKRMVAEGKLAAVRAGAVADNWAIFLPSPPSAPAPAPGAPPARPGRGPRAHRCYGQNKDRRQTRCKNRVLDPENPRIHTALSIALDDVESPPLVAGVGKGHRSEWNNKYQR